VQDLGYFRAARSHPRDELHITSEPQKVPHHVATCRRAAEPQRVPSIRSNNSSSLTAEWPITDCHCDQKRRPATESSISAGASPIGGVLGARRSEKSVWTSAQGRSPRTAQMTWGPWVVVSALSCAAAGAIGEGQGGPGSEPGLSLRVGDRGRVGCWRGLDRLRGHAAATPAVAAANRGNGRRVAAKRGGERRPDTTTVAVKMCLEVSRCKRP
jgi:hypothetical protein